jgi:hypothetical protein
MGMQRIRMPVPFWAGAGLELYNTLYVIANTGALFYRLVYYIMI